jgi:hypothetical protein
MNKIFAIGLFLFMSHFAFGQDSDSVLLSRFNNCDTTLTDFDIIRLIFQFRDESEVNQNNGLLEELQSLETDSLFVEIENRCSTILLKSPVNLTASFYLTISQLRLQKIEKLECSWEKTEMLHSAIKRFGKGTESEPYIVSDLNDAKSLIYFYSEEGVKIDSVYPDKNDLTQLFICKPTDQKEIIYFDFRNEKSIREVFFDYHRDYRFYLNESANPESDYFYDILLKRFLKEDITLKNHELIALMIGFTENQNYYPYKNVDFEREIMKLVRDKEYKKALSKSRKLLDTNPLNFTALIEEGFTLMKIKKDKKYYPSTCSRMLVNAVLWSGDGSIEHPYFVLSPIDGQTIIRYIFGNRIGLMGSGDDQNGYFLDILEMIKENDESETLYFILEHAVQKSELKKQIDKAIENLNNE